ncbi:MAG: ribosome biogenesis GTPase YlqF [Vulcanimicrobiota bacterium]
MNFSWFPGHMKKTIRKLSQEQKIASMAIMVLDARCPRSSRNPELEKLFTNKPCLYILNKADLASQKITDSWLKYFREQKMEAMATSCKTGRGKKTIITKIHEIKKMIQASSKSRRFKTNFRIVVLGIPNSGKSSLINMLSPHKTVRTGKKPGLTRGKQWLKIQEGIEVLDSPGVMLPRMDLPETPWILGVIAAIKQEVLPVEQVAIKFIEYLRKNNLIPNHLIKEDIPEDPLEVLTRFSVERGYLVKGGDVEMRKGALQLLKIFREGKLGRISLEKPG